MRKIYFLFSLLISVLIFAQVPKAFSYQAIILNSSGQPVVSGNVSIRISILDNSATGTVLYTETHSKTTNSKGLVNLNIGQGTVVTGTFSGIDWSTNPKFIKVESDPTGGSNYTDVGTNQLMSVPYSIVSKTLVSDPGEGITLVSPNGTKYKVTVNDSGQLSLPTSNTSSITPSKLYLYGSFNNWDPSTALEFGNGISPYPTGAFSGFMYLKYNTKIKFLADKTGNVVYGGNTFSSGNLAENGPEIIVPSTGFYHIYVQGSYYQIYSVNMEFSYDTMSLSTFNNESTLFNYTGPNTNYIYMDTKSYGDNLKDGSLDYGGPTISVPSGNILKTRIYFNGTGTYVNAPIYTPPSLLYLNILNADYSQNTSTLFNKISTGVFQKTYTFNSAPTNFLFSDNTNYSSSTVIYSGSDTENILRKSTASVINTAGTYTITVDFNTSSVIFVKN